jgi:PPOX class probable F420-dependent enzyme
LAGLHRPCRLGPGRHQRCHGRAIHAPGVEVGVTSEGSGHIPDSHRDLLERPLTAALSTLMPEGYPQTHPVWFSFTEPYVLVNTMRGFRKERNMRADPRVTMLIVDPGAVVHWIELRGLVELAEDGASDHLDALANRYVGAHRFFGEVVPAALARTEAPVIGRIRPLRVVTDGEAEAATARGHHNARSVAEEQAAAGAGEAGEVAGRSARMPIAVIPNSHRDLLAKPLRATLATLLPDGQPQTQPVWFGFDGTDVLINTACQRQKGRNMSARPKATVLVVDPKDGGRWIEIRGDVSVSREGALDHLDRLTHAYTGKRHFYGDVVPIARRQRETRIVCRIRPRHVVCDAVHH